jgi:hypothetical protein
MPITAMSAVSGWVAARVVLGKGVELAVGRVVVKRVAGIVVGATGTGVGMTVESSLSRFRVEEVPTSDDVPWEIF